MLKTALSSTKPNSFQAITERYSETQLSIHSKHDYEFKPEIQRGASMCTGKVGRNGQQRDELQEERQEEKRKGK